VRRGARNARREPQSRRSTARNKVRRGARNARREPQSRRATARNKVRRGAPSRRSTAQRATRLAYLAFGSNIGHPRRRIARALAEAARLGRLRAVSSLYRTEPVGGVSQPDFYNAVAALEWSGSPRELLRATQEIERRVGRTPGERNGPREIDVDILDLGGLTRTGADPVLPHPRMRERRFVLAPLVEIAPEWRHPAGGESAAELLRALPARPAVRRLSSSPRGSSARRSGS
jgi:2-amino-4-hydroxy-6-hydroxymethyldihydropteridine diphosphokinase